MKDCWLASLNERLVRGESKESTVVQQKVCSDYLE